jgi:hypothetical protein
VIVSPSKNRLWGSKEPPGEYRAMVKKSTRLNDFREFMKKTIRQKNNSTSETFYLFFMNRIASGNTIGDLVR